ncbi:hypothetical protein MKW94_007984 [Papaver nudicaule]|uniref:E3 ubiquitin-protein ligase PRT1-like n=1 Tax=Papaver nudicaule TaxID=74823 RepID=A0AA41V9N5_PAPNU|nr:hypothetical protein [Papaver nudicaule]
MEEAEQIDDSFVCGICLELLHKPVVLACGHMSCFWCAHDAMNLRKESHCPICRHVYNHFPSICEILHVLLRKKYPITCQIREMQLLEEEKKRDVFSTQLHFSNSRINSELTTPAVSISDALCITCKKMLFQPVILNCGHAYCKSCLAEDEPSCQFCQTPHPNGFPKVCLVLDSFFGTEFPQEYAQRRQDLQHNPVRCQQGIASLAWTTSANQEVPLSNIELSQSYSASTSGSGPYFHYGVGCDYCGMYPIAGERYRCKDCVESIGFDLCGTCYNTGSNSPRRFNQQHKEGHSFELVTQRR